MEKVVSQLPVRSPRDISTANVLDETTVKTRKYDRFLLMGTLESDRICRIFLSIIPPPTADSSVSIPTPGITLQNQMIRYSIILVLLRSKRIDDSGSDCKKLENICNPEIGTV
jgi:hypothetical protein